MRREKQEFQKRVSVGVSMQDTRDQNLMSCEVQATAWNLPVCADAHGCAWVGGLVTGTRPLHPWTVSMLMGASIKVGVALFIQT